MARPKRKFSDEQIKQIEQYAYAGCQDGTIATLMDLPLMTLRDRFRNLMRKKRAERRFALRQAQLEKAVLSKDTGMLCFLGKNELEQSDRQDIKHSGGVQLLAPLVK